MMNVFFLFCCLMSASCSKKETKDLLLFDNATSEYAIVTVKDATKTERKAAMVLQQQLKKITGFEFPLKTENADTYFKGKNIYIGNTRSASKFKVNIQNDGFLLATDAQSVYIIGGKGQGTLYGVYEFLEKYLQCNKYDAEAAFIPELKQISLKANIYDLQIPQFSYREAYFPAAFNDEFLEWNKLHRFEDLWGLWGHTYFKLVPPETYFKSHPEYFSLVNNKRQPLQLCLSNKDVLNISVAYLKEQMKKKPWAEYWSVSANDDIGFCTCDLCTKADAEEGSHAGSLIRFVNAIASQFPEAKFTTLAYQFTSKAPKKTRPAKNVYIMLSSIDAYRTKPLLTEPSAAPFRNDLYAWKSVTNNIIIWDYTTQFTNYLAPFPDVTHEKPNISLFAANNAKGVFMQGSENTYSDFAELKSYVVSKLLWNPNLDADSLIQKFCKDYYKQAAPYVLQYLSKRYNALQLSKKPLDIYGNPINDYNGYLSPSLIDEYSQILDKAEAAVEENAAVYKRVVRLRLPLEYTVLQQSKFFGHEKFGFRTVNDNGDVTVKSNWPVRIEKFVSAMKTAGVNGLVEGGITPDEYLQQWKNIFKTPFKPNKASESTVTLVNPFAAEYPSKKERTLIDAVPGYTDFSYNWLLFYGKDMIATIDMGKTISVKAVETNFLFDPRHWIFKPQSISIEVSSDGKIFTQAAQITNKPDEEDFAVTITPYQFKLNGVNARYIRVTAKNLPALPSWRTKPNRLPSVACDEIYIY